MFVIDRFTPHSQPACHRDAGWRIDCRAPSSLYYYRCLLCQSCAPWAQLKKKHQQYLCVLLSVQSGIDCPTHTDTPAALPCATPIDGVLCTCGHFHQTGSQRICDHPLCADRCAPASQRQYMMAPPVSRTPPLGRIAGTLLVIGALARCGGANRALGHSLARPNIVFLICESIDGRTFHADSPVPLPNIDKLRFNGSSFHNHYVNAPVCAASRSSLWSGRLPHHIPHETWGVKTDVVWG